MNMDWTAPKKGQMGFCNVCHRDRKLTGKFRTRDKKPDKGAAKIVRIEEAALKCGHFKPLRILQ